MSAVENLLKRKGPGEVETAEIIQDGEHRKVDVRRARSLVSRGLAEWAVESAEAPVSSEQDFEGVTAQSEPAADSQVASKPLRDMNKAELTAYATELSLDTDGTNAELRDRIRDHLSAAESGANAEDEPLSGSDSDGN